MLDFLLGPFLSLLPRPWRAVVPFSDAIQWNRAGTAGGFLQAVLAIVALGYWYMHAMSSWVDTSVSNALNGAVGSASVQQIGGFALTLWIMHPLTALLAYFIFEGALRMCSSAFAGEVPGTLPLAILDWFFVAPFRPRRSYDLNAFDAAVSFLADLRNRILFSRLPRLRDELSFTRAGTEETLLVSSTHPKKDWIPPAIVRFEGDFYRLEKAWTSAAPRPFRYSLRHLPAGVATRKVLFYSPGEALIRQSS